MKELVKAIRDGSVCLSPRKDSGWYDMQVYALESFLLPERGKEYNKIMLIAKYKERMLEAFKALITKQRETHARQLSTYSAKSAPARRVIASPRLRVEPNPTYYLRTARSYAFLQAYLEATLPADAIARPTGKTKNGDRGVALLEELESIKRLFYGFYLVSSEDIGMRSQLVAGELEPFLVVNPLARRQRSIGLLPTNRIRTSR